MTDPNLTHPTQRAQATKFLADFFGAPPPAPICAPWASAWPLAAPWPLPMPAPAPGPSPMPGP